MISMIGIYLYNFLYDGLCSPAILLAFCLVKDGTMVTDLVCFLFNAIIFSLLLWILKSIYKIFFIPMNYYRGDYSVGYINHHSVVPAEEAYKEARKNKKIGNIPPVYPNGWFHIMDSRSIKCGEVKSAYAFGQHLVVFRNKRGKVRIMNAYCPHLGVNLAAGGKVVNSDCLECPFHGWKFDGETGKLIDVPYAEKVPTFVSIPTWYCCEENDMVYMWYHCDEEEPQWKMPVAEGIKNLKYAGRTEHIVHCHVEEIPENGADTAHLAFLHKPVIGNDVQKTNHSILNNIIHHGILARWRPPNSDEESHMSFMDIDNDIILRLGNFSYTFAQLKFYVTQIGPGAVIIRFQTPVGHGIMVQNVTPIEPLRQRVTHAFYFSKWVPMIMGKIFIGLEATQVERDILMWNNKTYAGKPVLVKEEAGLAKHRRWYHQFYTKNSPRLNAEGDLIYPGKIDVNDW